MESDCRCRVCGRRVDLFQTAGPGSFWTAGCPACDDYVSAMTMEDAVEAWGTYNRMRAEALPMKPPRARRMFKHLRRKT